VREVAETVREIGLTPWSAQGTAERQAWVADLADEGIFGPKLRRSLRAARTGALRPTGYWRSSKGGNKDQRMLVSAMLQALICENRR
jgi:hypothetical protein